MVETPERTSEDPQEESPVALPFDEAACESLRQAVIQVIQEHPEVRSVALVLDFHGSLNDATVQKGLWIGEEGPVMSPDAIVGSSQQTLRLQEEQLARMWQVNGGMRESIQVLGEELVKLNTEKEELVSRLEPMRVEAAKLKEAARQD